MSSNRLDIGSVRAISWDVDGTLYSTNRVACRLWLTTLAASLGGDAHGAWKAMRELRRFRARMERIRAVGMPVESDISAIEQRLALERRWLVPAVAAVGARPGAAAVLGKLAGRLRAQVALSDFESRHKLASLGLLDYFDAVYSGETLGSLKPSPRSFRRVLTDFGLQPEQLLHIGDRRETDGAGATEAGCQVLVLGLDFRSFKELGSMLGAAGSAQSAPLGLD